MPTTASTSAPRGTSRSGLRSARLAIILWVVFAVFLWNDIFDQVIIDAGREYVFSAFASAATGGPFLRMGGAMSAATVRAFWFATAVACPVLAVGLVAVRRARRRTEPTGPEDARAHP